MLKKVLAGVFVLVMVGAVVAGAIALFSRSDSAYACQSPGRQEGVAVAGRGLGGQGAAGEGQGRGGNNPEGETPRGGFGQGSQSGSQRGGFDNEQAEAPKGNAGRNSPGGDAGRGQGQGNGKSPGAQLPTASTDLDTIQGLVVETSELAIETADGQIVQVGLGPSHYREGQGFVLNVGDEVQVSGYWENGEFKAVQVENLATGDSIVLRDSSGRPIWAGQGRGQGA